MTKEELLDIRDKLQSANAPEEQIMAAQFCAWLTAKLRELRLAEIPAIYPGWEDQVYRACLSVSANIAEGWGRLSTNNTMNFYIMARGSATETLALLNLCPIPDAIPAASIALWERVLAQIDTRLSSLVQTRLTRS